MKQTGIRIVLIVLFVLTVLFPTVASVNITNGSFENPTLSVRRFFVDGIQEWFSSGECVGTRLDGHRAGAPETPYGDNWAQLYDGAWIYQQIGTWGHPAEYRVSLLLSVLDAYPFAGVHVSLWTGGNETLAANGMSLSDLGAHLQSESGVLTAPSTEAAMGIDVELRACTGVRSSDALWLQIQAEEGVTARQLIDHVRITESTFESNPCQSNRTIVPADINADYAVDFLDAALLAAAWQWHDTAIFGFKPDETRLRVYYPFEQSQGSQVLDLSGLDHHAALTSSRQLDPWDAAGHLDSYCMELAEDLQVVMPESVFETIHDQVTIAMWVREEIHVSGGKDQTVTFSAGQVPQADHTWDQVVWEADPIEPNESQWHHYALTKDASAGTMRIYVNGILVSHSTDAFEPMTGTQAGESILALSSGSLSRTWIDEFRVYDYSLSQAEIVYLEDESDGQVIQTIEPVLTRADINDDGQVNGIDLMLLAEAWLSQ